MGRVLGWHSKSFVVFEVNLVLLVIGCFSSEDLVGGNEVREYLRFDHIFWEIVKLHQLKLD